MHNHVLCVLYFDYNFFKMKFTRACTWDLAQFPHTTEITWRAVNNKHQDYQCKPGNPTPWPCSPLMCSAGSAGFSRATLRSLLRTALRPLWYYTGDLSPASPQAERDGKPWVISSGWISLLRCLHVAKRGWANCSAGWAFTVVCT